VRVNPGDLLTPFESATVNGAVVPHGHLWQHRNVVLFVLPDKLDVARTSYLEKLDRRLHELKPPDTSLVIAHRIDGVPPNTIVITDRWGEVVHIAPLESDVSVWPAIDDIIEWVSFIRMKCPECPA
jgi:hypothetical protein